MKNQQLTKKQQRFIKADKQRTSVKPKTDMYLDTLIPVAGEIKDIKPSNGKRYTLEEMQEMVGGYIDIIPSATGEFSYVVNDNGRYCKEFNPTATMHFTLRSGYRENPLFGNIAIISKNYLR
ncbi:DUF3846 domain-containing protein [Pontibacter sp. FD36]|uniref:DUF3846 domain-containing protein n=1 Tax=Pontibacter sp. FD36 TaxID=2789860 RepID=UPI0018A8C1F4|nr:DUF3846 domain-containing protein [Pontibacter sp. FD36]MBF8962325.1 DUF3846 domain-containing protein [Pontibacter sp. FD36]